MITGSTVVGSLRPALRRAANIAPRTGRPGAKRARAVGRFMTDGQMSWRDVAFDADLVANVLGNLARAPTLHAGDVDLGKSANGH